MPHIINAIHKYRPRGSWGQRPVQNIQKLVIHHTAADASDNPETRLNEIKNWHLANSSAWMGLSYHYVITKNGNIYQTNKHEDLTWHDGTNWNSLGILVDGYFHPPINNQPTFQQLESLEWLLTDLATKHLEFPAGNNPLQDIVGHRDVGSTACPGNLLYPKLVEIKQRINQKVKNPQPAKTPLPDINPPTPPKPPAPIVLDAPWKGNSYYEGIIDKQNIDLAVKDLTDRDKEIAELKKERDVLFREGQEWVQKASVLEAQKSAIEQEKNILATELITMRQQPTKELIPAENPKSELPLTPGQTQMQIWFSVFRTFLTSAFFTLSALGLTSPESLDRLRTDPKAYLTTAAILIVQYISEQNKFKAIKNTEIK